MADFPLKGQGTKTGAVLTTKIRAGRPQLKLCALSILAILPILYVTYLIYRYGVNVPYADEFALAPDLVKAHQHTLIFSDLFAQHNEHRYFFPLLLFIAFSFIGQGDLRAEMFFSVFLGVLGSVNLAILLRKTAALSVGQWLLAVFFFNVLLFSPVQAENWVWAYQLPIFFCNYLLTCGILAAFSSISLARKFALCTVLAVMASFSFGGGVVVWAVTFPVALLAEKTITWKWRAVWLGAWCAAALACIAIYLFHYVKPPSHPPLAASSNPVEYFFYITGFLGAHLYRASSAESNGQPVVVGTVLLFLFLGSMVYATLRRHAAGVSRQMLPWFGLGGYALLSAVLAALTRIGFGANQALDSRYTSFSLYLSVALVALLMIIKQDLGCRALSPAIERALVRGEMVVLTGFTIFSLVAFSWGHDFMVTHERTRLLGKGALLFTNVIPNLENQTEYLVVNGPQLKEFANQFDSIGLINPPMLKSAEIAKLKTLPKPAGFVDDITSAGQSCSVTGWAILPNALRPAHCVVLSYNQPGKGEVAFAVSDEAFVRSDVVKALDATSASWSGWRCHFDRSALPPGDLLVNGWAFDANRAILYPLGTPQIVH